MDRVLDRLWVGSTEDAQAPLATLGFTGLLDLRDHSAMVTHSGIDVHHIEQRDGDPWTVEDVRRALAFVAEKIRKGSVLIVCAAGMSRSVSMVVGYLVMVGWSETDAFEQVRRAHPDAAPVPKMLDSVLAAVRS